MKKSVKKPPPSEFEGTGANMAVGYRPAVSRASSGDRELFRAFQANLLSMISHELRTPLMGVLNALSLLQVAPDGTVHSDAENYPAAEALSAARRNAERLQQSLGVLLDLAAIESGAFHVRFREVELGRLIRQRGEAWARLLPGQLLEITQENITEPVLADPVRLARLVELCLAGLARFAVEKSTLYIRISKTAVEFEVEAPEEQPGGKRSFTDIWNEAQVAVDAGVGSTGSAFGALVQSEREFLSRGDEEGMGGEFLLALEIARLHRARLVRLAGLGMRLEFEQIQGRERLLAVLASRTYHAASEMASVMLILVDVPEDQELSQFYVRVGRALFRESDEVYAFPSISGGADKERVALVLHDCKREDGPGLMGRVSRALGGEVHWGFAHCPSDSLDSDELVKIALRRLMEQS